MKNISVKIISALMVVLMILSFCACSDDEVTEEQKADVSLSDIPKSSEDIIDYYNNVVLSLLEKNADKVTCEIAKDTSGKSIDSGNTYLKVKDINAYKISLNEKLVLDEQIEALQVKIDEATKAKDQKRLDELNKKKNDLDKSKEKNNKIKSSAKGLLNLILSKREERTDDAGLPVTGTNIPTAISINEFSKVKSILGDDTSNPNAVKSGVYYTLNLSLDDYTDPDENSILNKLIDLPDTEKYVTEFASASRYLKLNDYTVTYKDLAITVDVDKTNDQIAYITYKFNAYVNAEVEGTGKLQNAGVSTVEFRFERSLKIKFNWPEEVK